MRCVAFIAGLALNQGKPSIAVQILKDADFNQILPIKLLALADLGYANEIIEVLSTWINNEKYLKHKISMDVVSK